MPGLGHLATAGQWGQRAREGWRCAVLEDAGTAKVPLPPRQMGPSTSLARAPALAASSWLLLQRG